MKSDEVSIPARCGLIVASAVMCVIVFLIVGVFLGMFLLLFLQRFEELWERYHDEVPEMKRAQIASA